MEPAQHRRDDPPRGKQQHDAGKRDQADGEHDVAHDQRLNGRVGRAHHQGGVQCIQADGEIDLSVFLPALAAHLFRDVRGVAVHEQGPRLGQHHQRFASLVFRQRGEQFAGLHLAANDARARVQPDHDLVVIGDGLHAAISGESRNA